MKNYLIMNKKLLYQNKFHIGDTVFMKNGKKIGF